MTFKPQVDPSHYGGLTYDTKERYLSYWHQLDLVVRSRPRRVLEIGIGNGFLHRELRRHGLSVTTADADARLSPDVTASILELPFADGEYDVVCCFETLEHLPWEEFPRALRELRRVSSAWVLLSLPDVSPCLSLNVRVGARPALLDILRELPAAKRPQHRFNGEHYWEIGKRGYPLARILETCGGAGLSLEEHFRVREHPYHHFFRFQVQP